MSPSAFDPIERAVRRAAARRAARVPARAPARAPAGTSARAAAFALLASLTLLHAPPLVRASAEAETRATSAHGVGPIVVEGDILTSRASGRRAVGSGGVGQLWRNGEIPYRLDGALGASGVRAVQRAIERWNAVAGITFLPIEPGAPLPADHVVFEPGEGCASWVGRQGGAQSVWVGSDCTAGSVMHEIGHALGLEHEHTRSDRDAHVRVNWARIRPEKHHNFDIAPSGSRLLGDYDLESIMHYGGWNFSLDGGQTLEALDPVAGARMGQRESPSAGDIAAIARLYRSDLALVVKPDTASAARAVTLFVTNEHRQGAHAIALSLRAPGLRLPKRADSGNWRCAYGKEGAHCTLQRLDSGGRSELRFVLDEPLRAEALGATLASKTPDIDLSDNGFGVGFAPPLGAAQGDKAPVVLADAFDGAFDGTGEGPPREGGGSGGAGAPSTWLVMLGGLIVLRRRRVPRGRSASRTAPAAHCTSG